MKIFITILITGMLIFSGATLFKFRSDIETAKEQVKKYNPKILKTSFGDVEYNVKGTGLPVLVVHGIVGGFDQATITGESIFGEGYKIIGVSRFGYLNSDIPSNPTPKNQSKAYKELLDHLEVDQVIVLAASAGGAPAYRFLLDYPEKVKSLVLVGSGQPENKEVEGPLGPPSFVLNDFMFWMMSGPMRSMIMSSMFGIEKETYENSSLKEKETLDKLFEVMLPIKPRKPGIINDTEITNADMLNNYNEYNLESIEKQILIFHAKNDPMASYESSVKAHERLPNSELYSFETGGHMIYGHENEIKKVLNNKFK